MKFTWNLPSTESFQISGEMYFLGMEEIQILTNYLWDNQLFCTVCLRLNMLKCLLVEQGRQWSNSLWNGTKPTSRTDKHP